MEYIASLSYGKDSLYMLEIIHKNNLPLDRIIHASIMATPTISADLPEMVDFKIKADEIILKKYGIKVEHISSSVSYEENFYRKKTHKNTNPKNIGKIYGFPYLNKHWCNPILKMQVLNKFNKRGIHQYVGYAIDEKDKKRQDLISNYIAGDSKFNGTYPLVDFKITEKECFDWCDENELLSPIYKNTLRGGCWFCHFKPLQQLYDLKTNFPEYWKLMLKWDLDSPISFKDKFTLHDLDKRFEAGFVYKRPYDKYLKGE